ncbi:MAG TPA: hypothetical protein VFV81_04700 [Verrucomicrobiae bacterium]|nr:hypothetical protein [Verrucomicrobiae bacterium]
MRSTQINAGAAGWQNKCTSTAEQREVFEVQGVQSEHTLFLAQLCSKMHYLMSYRYCTKSGKTTAHCSPMP